MTLAGAGLARASEKVTQIWDECLMTLTETTYIVAGHTFSQEVSACYRVVPVQRVIGVHCRCCVRGGFDSGCVVPLAVLGYLVRHRAGTPRSLTPRSCLHRHDLQLGYRRCRLSSRRATTTNSALNANDISRVGSHHVRESPGSPTVSCRA